MTHKRKNKNKKRLLAIKQGIETLNEEVHGRGTLLCDVNKALHELENNNPSQRTPKSDDVYSIFKFIVKELSKGRVVIFTYTKKDSSSRRYISRYKDCPDEPKSKKEIIEMLFVFKGMLKIPDMEDSYIVKSLFIDKISDVSSYKNYIPKDI